MKQFLPFDQVLDTMLHELVHNVQGEHNDRFHEIWNELRDEWYTLQIKGYTGEGFLGKGNMVGGQRVPVEEARRRARATALERQKQNTLQKDPGHRLGGSVPPRGIRGRHMRDIIAGAVQRRNQNEQPTGGCGTGNRIAERASEDALKNGFRTKAEMDDANDAAISQALIELMEQEEERILQGLPAHPSSPTASTSGGLTWDPEHGLQPAAPPVPTQSKPPSSAAARLPNQRPAPKPAPHSHDLTARGRPVSRLVQEAQGNKNEQSSTPQKPSQSAPPSSHPAAQPWECPVCTLLNAASHPACGACETERPSGRASSSTSRWAAGVREAGLTSHAPIGGPLGWNCWNCGSFMENQWWTCSLCGCMKASS